MKKKAFKHFKKEFYLVDNVRVSISNKFKDMQTNQAQFILEELSLFLLQNDVESAKRLLLTYKPYFTFEKEKNEKDT